MPRQLFYGKLSEYSVFANGTNGFIRVRGDFSTSSKTITNVVDVNGYEGLDFVRVGQSLIASTVMPNATVITAVDPGAGTITVEDFPASNGTNSLARVSPADGTYFFRSASLLDPQGKINFSDITGSNDSDYNTGDQAYAILGQAFDGSSNVVGRFHKYNITEVVYRNTPNTEGSLYVEWGEGGNESDTPDTLSTSQTVTPIVGLSTNESLAPIFAKSGVTGITDLPAGSDAAAYQIEVQSYFDDLVTTDVSYTGSLVTSGVSNMNFIGDGVTVVSSGSSGVTVNIPGGDVGSAFPYTGSARITGSLDVIGFTNLTGSTFIQGTIGQDALAIYSGSEKKVSVNSEGVLKLDEFLYTPTAVSGGLMYSASSFWMGD